VARFPALFVSHGAPLLAIRDVPARRFLRELGARLGRPRAVLVATAHWDTAEPMLGAAPAPATIYDFHGFPEALYRLRYPAPGAPEFARRAAGLLGAAGIAAGEDRERGFDHGTWIPLLLMYPEADVPVVQLSIQPHHDPAHHFRVGRALRPLRDDDVLILGSGTFTHNLPAAFRAMRGDEAAELPFTAPFADWIAGCVATGAADQLVAYRERAPYARENHPTDEHFLPFFVALGAGSEGEAGERLHHSTDFAMAMDAYAFP
jgi:4,5-DOPA dioxygenase extradiol